MNRALDMADAYAVGAPLTLNQVLSALGYTSARNGDSLRGKVIYRNGRRLGFFSASHASELIARGARKWRALKGISP